MKSLIATTVLVCAAATNAFAQDPAPEWLKFEIAGGYSFTTMEPDSVTNLAVGHLKMPAGWTAGATWFFKEDTGLVFEYGRHTAQQDLGPFLGTVDASLRTIMGGGRFVDRFGNFEFAIRVLGGITRTTTEGSTNATAARRVHDSSATAMFGGGLDYLIGHIGIRLVHGEVVYAPVSKRTPAFNLAAGAFVRF